MKVLLAGGGTGGHLMPALALAQAMREARADIEPVLVGAERGIEAQVLPRYPFPFHLLPIEPIYRRTWWKNVRWALIAGRVWRAVGRVLEAEQPAIVVGTGGYAAGPVVWRAQRAQIPTALVEENAYPGVTTRWLARGARQVHLGFPEAGARLTTGPTTQVFTLGNPVRSPATEEGDGLAVLADLGLSPDRPTLLVFGGSQGARAINYAVAGALERRLLDGMNVLWGTGEAQAAAFIGYAVPGRVVVRGFFDPMTTAYRAADLVVARAGAMTLAELCAWGKPSILIPLPTAAADHQTQNALALAAAGAAIHLAEADLTPHTLAESVRSLLGDQDRLAVVSANARARGHPDAAREIVSKILTLSR
ncbi:MAG TPA: undecaprenyldiphospho-muramoylpentapeptide beta-N-acetylglucosaminyltransferase [Gemmatimonadales bacterium]|nr:undecaprenyldiphospho-muramoylpentapeptide beta-N-acetylglucosaminyltransferase [Gemmatimonadales bacterium]